MKNKFLLLTMSSFALLVSGCGKDITTPGVNNDPNTINIKLFLGGYGEEWLRHLGKKFEEAYAKEGYKVNLLKPRTDLAGGSVANELFSGYEKNKIDIYFTAAVMPEGVVEALNFNNQTLVDDLSDEVYGQKAIGYDGKEEEKTLREKIGNDFEENRYKYKGKEYTFLYQKSIGGLGINMAKLQKFGLDIPRTTKEMHHCFETILSKYEETRIKPFTFLGAKESYSLYYLYNILAQYQGVDEFYRWWSMEDKDGKPRLEDGYKIYEDKAVQEMIRDAYRTYDRAYANSTAADQDLNQAHDTLMKKNGGAVFLFDGNWMLNEIAADYPNEMKNIRMANIPLISALGKRLWGERYGEEKSDQILSLCAKWSDEGKSSEEMVTLAKNETTIQADISLEEAETVRKARGLYINVGSETGTAYVTKNTAKKDIAFKFLRMFASDDFALDYKKIAHCISPFDNSTSSSSHEFPLMADVDAITHHKEARGIWHYPAGLRKAIGGLETVLPSTGNNTAISIYSEGISVYDRQTFKKTKSESIYDKAADARWNNEWQKAARDWPIWLQRAGY